MNHCQKYTDLDSSMAAIEAHFCLLKHGYSRLSENLSSEIRQGRISREQAVAVIKESNELYPEEYISWLREYLRIDAEDFKSIAAEHRNKEVFQEVENFFGRQ